MTKLFRTSALWAVSAAVTGVALLGNAMANLPPADRIAFAVFRGDSPIGHHRLSFERAGEDLLVNVDIELKVKFAMFTLYDYKHRSRETWRDGRLVGLDTKTNDNGDKFFVRAAATQDGLERFRLEMEDALIDLAADSYDRMGHPRPANLVKRPRPA